MKEKVNWCKLHSCLILRNCHQPSVPTTLISLWLTTLRQNPPPSKKITAQWRLSGFPVALVVKNSASAGDPRHAGSTPGLGRPPGGENSNPLKFLPRKFHGQRRLTGYGIWGCCLFVLVVVVVCVCVFVCGWFKGVIFSREFYAVGIPSACLSVACLHLSLYFLLSLPLTFPCLLPGKKAIFFFFSPRVCWNIKLPHNLLPHTNALQFQLKHLLLFSHSVVSNSLQPHGLQHTRLPCPSLSPGVCSNSYTLSQWCHPTISSSVIIKIDPKHGYCSCLGDG